MMDNRSTGNIREVFKQIVNMYGIEVLNDTRLVNALFKDLAPKEERERKIIVNVLNEGISNGFINCNEMDISTKQNLVNRSISALITEAWISEAGAKYAVYSLVYALGWTEILKNERTGINNEIVNPEKNLVLQKGNNPITNTNLLQELTKYYRINYKAFSGFYDLNEINLPESIKVIGSKAFLGCYNLKKISFSNRVESIGARVFEGCYNLKEIIVDPDNKNFCSVDNVLIDKKKKMIVRVNNSERNVYKVPEGIMSIAGKAFDRNAVITVCLPRSLSKLYSNSFYLCELFSHFEVDPKNKNFISIDGVLHSKNKDVVLMYPMGRSNISYIIEDNVLEIGQAAFSHAERLVNITIPDSVELIGNNAFEYCVSLESLILPSSTKYIGDNSCYSCLNLRNVLLPRNIVEIGNRAFEECIQLMRISIPPNVEKIGHSAFRNCEKLVSVTIQGQVKFIGDGAFFGCKAEMVMNIKKDSYVDTYCKMHHMNINYI